MKLLKKLIQRIENQEKTTVDRVQLSQTTASSLVEIKEKKIQLSEQNIPIIVCRPTNECAALVRHFAINHGIKAISYLGFESEELNSSLAISLHGIKEQKYRQVKSLIEFEKELENQIVVISSESTRWLESLMHLRRSFSKVDVFIAGTQNHFLHEEKILSKYRENFSGAIMKKEKGMDKRYSARLLEKKLGEVPLVFLSDGVIKAGERSQQQNKAA